MPLWSCFGTTSAVPKSVLKRHGSGQLQCPGASPSGLVAMAARGGVPLRLRSASTPEAPAWTSFRLLGPAPASPATPVFKSSLSSNLDAAPTQIRPPLRRLIETIEPKFRRLPCTKSLESASFPISLVCDERGDPPKAGGSATRPHPSLLGLLDFLLLCLP